MELLLLSGRKQKCVSLHFFSMFSISEVKRKPWKIQSKHHFCCHSQDSMWVQYHDCKIIQNWNLGVDAGLQSKQIKISTISHPAGQSVIQRGSLFPPKDLLSAWRVPANSLSILFLNTWEGKSCVLLLWNLDIWGLLNPNQLFSPLIFSFCSSYSNVAVSTLTVLKPYLKIIVSLATAFVKLHFFPMKSNSNNNKNTKLLMWKVYTCRRWYWSSEYTNFYSSAWQLVNQSVSS